LGGHLKDPFDDVEEEDRKGNDFHDRGCPLLDGTEGKRGKDQQEDDAPFNDFIYEVQSFGSFFSLRENRTRCSD